MLGDLGESSGRWGLALDWMLSGSRVILIGYLQIFSGGERNTNGAKVVTGGTARVTEF